MARGCALLRKEVEGGHTGETAVAAAEASRQMQLDLRLATLALSLKDIGAHSMARCVACQALSTSPAVMAGGRKSSLQLRNVVRKLIHCM